MNLDSAYYFTQFRHEWQVLSDSKLFLLTQATGKVIGFAGSITVSGH